MPIFKDLTNQKFGKLTAVEPIKTNSNGRTRIKWICKCECGKEVVVIGHNLTSGHTKSCGCFNSELTTERNHKKTVHGARETRLYGVWHSMKNRCNNPNGKDYHLYGGRGIKVCPGWNSSFEEFRNWAELNGYDETAPFGKCTIDRIDNNKGYSPDNCRWITNAEQQKNKRKKTV